METHSHPLVGTARRMHPTIRSKIFELVEDGITNSKVIKKLLRKFVKTISKEDSVLPDPTDRAFYPLEKDIINAVHAAVSFGKYSVLDQIHLEKLVRQWIEDNEGRSTSQQKYLYFRKCSTEEGSSIKIELPKVQQICLVLNLMRVQTSNQMLMRVRKIHLQDQRFYLYIRRDGNNNC